ncbi:hypothetical protein [Legionella sainthelensi]|uniref:hypothetical protein n=1 Tax=Legionella sainthelensi TaxID=28087 RepID=UPI001FD0CA27|nr:hypothetical protein [Legionella sainthelensi]
MTPAKELQIVIEKSQEDVDQIIALVHSSNLPEGIKPFVIECIHLASWIPRALVEHKITVSNLKRLIFEIGFKINFLHKNSFTVAKTCHKTRSAAIFSCSLERCA